MLPASDICERARLSRDPRFDGRFFVAVVTTGVYCRPVCPARVPARENVRYYPSAAAAQEAGYRPCLRCRPETAAPVPEWSIGSALVVQGLRLIEAGLLDGESSSALAARVGVSARHLNRLFHQELGATPKSLAMARRRALAKRLIDDTELSLSQVAWQSGYRSLRRFNDDMLRCYGRSPGRLRSGPRRRPAPGRAIILRLPVRQPYNAAWMFEFLQRRALAGFEGVAAECYRRRILDADAREHWIEARWDDGALRVEVPACCAMPLGDILLRLRRVFDLDADSQVIDAHLAADPLLAAVVARHPGLRVPGGWDGFETAVRAVLGQQVSVDRATVLAGRLLEHFGENALLCPEALRGTTPAQIGMPGRRGSAISQLAQAAAAGCLDLHGAADPERLRRELCAIPGIGPWTAGYIAMRVARDPDGFPDNDWVVEKMLRSQRARGVRRGQRIEAWRPWRAYAVMYLWKRAQCERNGVVLEENA